MCPVVSAGKEKNIFFKSRGKNLLFNFESILTLKEPGFSDFGTAPEEGMESAFICNFVIQRPITMKFAIIIPRQKFYPATLKLLNYFWLLSGRKCWKVLNSLSFL